MDGDDYSCTDDEGGESDYIELEEDEVGPSSSGYPELDAQIIKPEKLLHEIDEMVNKTVAVMGITPSIGKVILHTFAWDIEKLFERFYEAESPEVFLKKHKVGMPKSDMIEFVVRRGKCMICFEKKSKLIGLSCEHLFCEECWNSYLLMRFRSEGDPFVSCPDTDCFLYLDEDSVCKLLKSPAEKDFYKLLLVQSFVNTNHVLQWCPAVKCGNVVKVKNAEFGPVSCSCGSYFCFLCSQEWHEPVNCDMLKSWLKKCSDDSETSNWLNANTKDCPQCHVTIEKDGGCNHMTCRSQTCKFEFCWMCLGPWKPHGSGWYSCNRFEDKEAKEARSAQEVSRSALQRYLHYYNRFINHQTSLKFENKLQEQIKIKMAQMQEKNFTYVETQFLEIAVRVLNKCRRTLMYTYAFAYYLKKNNLTEIFETNQSDLELATEQLSEKLERELDLDSDDLVKIKQEVQDRYRYVDHRREKLLKHCIEGFERNQWAFSIPQQQQQQP